MTKIAYSPLLLSIHGIRTTGKWQKELTEAAEKAGIRYRPLDFGYFMALSLLLPWARKSKVEWFHRECEHHLESLPPGQRASIVAHSFGSYLLAAALRKYSGLKFDRVILCGSIISRDYPWTSIVRQRCQVNAVLNEVGRKDIWASIVAWVVADAGQSGAKGFEDLAAGAVLERHHSFHGHSDFFHSSNYRDVWIPFIEGHPAEPVTPAVAPGRNWRFTATLVVSVLVLIGIAALFGARDKSAIDKKNRQLAGKTTTLADEHVPAPLQHACKALDDDGDTVNNCVDLCTDSDASIPVASDGCPLLLPISFDYDKTSLRPDAIARLDVVVATLKSNPRLTLEIVGHSRGRGTAHSDLAISQLRAEAVRDLLVAAGIPATQLREPKGQGSANPVAPEIGDTGLLNGGAALNDRVELRFQE